MSCDHLASHAIATIGAGLTPAERDYLQGVYDQPATLKGGERRDELVRAGKTLALRLRAMGASLPDHLDFDKGTSRAAVRFGRLALSLSALTSRSARQTPPALPTEPLEAQCKRWEAWQDDTSEEQAPLRAFFSGDYGDIAAYLNGREDAAEDCVGLLATHRKALLAWSGMPPALRTMLSALPKQPKASQLRAVLTGLCQTAGHPRCGGCGQWCNYDTHRCPPKLTDLEEDRIQAGMQIGTYVPQAAFAPLGLDEDAVGDLMPIFLDRMCYLTDDDEEGGEAFVPVVLKAQALRFLFERAGAPIPPDLAQAHQDELRYFPGLTQIRSFPTTWGGYAAVYDALVARGALGDPSAVGPDTPLLGADDVPVWAVVYDTTTEQTMMRVPRPAGETNVPYFVRIAGGEEGEPRYGAGRLGPEYGRKPVYAVLVAAPPPPGDVPRWQPVYLDRFDQPTQDAITVARSRREYIDQIRGLMEIAMRREGLDRRLLVEEAVGLARTRGSWQSMSRPFAVAATMAAASGDEATAAFIIETGIDDGEHAWSSVYGEAAVALQRGGASPEVVGRLLRRSYECALVNTSLSDTFLRSVSGSAFSCGDLDLAMQAVGSMRSEYSQMEQIGYLAAHFPVSRLPDLLALARTVGQPEYDGGLTNWEVRARCVSEVARRADAPDRAALAQEVYGLVTRQEQPDIRLAEALTNVAPLLTPEQRQDAIARVGAIGQSGSVPPLESQVRGLTQLAGALGGAEREQAALAALERAIQLPERKERMGTTRAEAIGDLFPHLPPAQRQAHFAGLLEAARSFDDGPELWGILEGVLPHTEGRERAAVMAVVETLKPNSREHVLRVLDRQDSE